MQNLPAEICREIFSYFRDERRIESHSDDPLIFFRNKWMNWDSRINEQSQRFKFLTICKFLQPIAEELLYADVYLQTSKHCQYFNTCLNLQKEHNQCSLAYLTRGLNIGSLQAEDKLMNTIKYQFPNLSSLFIGLCDQVKIDSFLRMLSGWPTTIQVFHWDISRDLTDILTPVLSNFSNITTLHLSVWTSIRLQEPLTLPVKRLSIWPDADCHTDFENILCPSLEWFSFGIQGNMKPVVNFLNRHSSTLIGVEVIHPYQFIQPRTTVPLFSLPNLEVLILPCWFWSLDADLLEQEGNPRLHTLILHTHVQMLEYKSWRQFVQKIRPKTLTQLKRAVFIFGNKHQREEKLGKAELNMISGEFLPDVVIEYQNSEW